MPAAGGKIGVFSALLRGETLQKGPPQAEHFGVFGALLRGKHIKNNTFFG